MTAAATAAAQDEITFDGLIWIDRNGNGTTPPTTTRVVAQAGTRSGLASTGASPLGFLALGGLLLVAGTSVLLRARRRS